MKSETFNRENYNAEKIIINIYWANLFGFIVLLVALALFAIPFIIIWNEKTPLASLSLLNITVYIAAVIIGIAVHEAIHGVFFALFSEEKFKSIKFGILPKEKLFIPYCHCREILSVNQYRTAAIMPLLVLGIIPAVVSLVYGNFLLLLYGVLFISAGCGDFLMILKLIKEKKNACIYDLPDDAGFIVYRQKIG